MSSLLFPRFLPPRFFPDTEGDGAGDDGMDAVARIRRNEMIVSNDSSNGSVNSSRKKGCPERFSDGEGEGIDTGVELFERGE
jgi:hypothetical protein